MIALAWFARRQFTLPKPMIALDLFHISAFATSAGASWLTFTSQGLAFVALPFYSQESLGLTPLQSGLLLTAWPLSIAIVAPLAGRLSDRYPAGILATIALAVYACGLAFYDAVPACKHAGDHPAWRRVRHRQCAARKNRERVRASRGRSRQRANAGCDACGHRLRFAWRGGRE